MKKSIFAVMLAGSLAAASLAPTVAYADGQKVVTLGADLTDEQKTAILKYFGIYGQSLETLYITNQDERDHLASYVPLEQIGTRTFSCALVNPTTSGGIRVKTANLNWVTSNMIATTLSTSGVVNCEVLAASPFEVSGTGALTGIIMAYETASGATLDAEKKEIATQELITTGTIANQIGQTQATDIVNEIKIQVIGGEVKDTEEVVEVVNDVLDQKLDVESNLSDEDRQLLMELAERIAQQDYDYDEMRETLERVEDNVSDLNDTVSQVASAIDENIAAVEENTAAVEENTASLDENTSAMNALTDQLSKDSILMNTDDSALGDNVLMDATDEEALQEVKGAENAETPEEGGFTITIGDSWSDGSEPQPEQPAYVEPAAEPQPEQPVYEEPAAEPQPEQPAYEEPVNEEPQENPFIEISNSDEYTDAPEEPAYEEPVNEEPVYEEPAYEEPVDEEPAYEEPANEEPANEEPAYEEPVDEEPAYEEPAYEEPVDEEPAYEEPVDAGDVQDEEPAAEEEVPVLEIGETVLTTADAYDEYSAAGAGILKLLLDREGLVPIDGTVSVTDSFGTTYTVDLADESAVTTDPMSGSELQEENWSEGTRVLIVLGDSFEADMSYDVSVEGTFAQAEDPADTDGAPVAEVSEFGNFSTDSYGIAMSVSQISELYAGSSITAEVLYDDAEAVYAEITVEDETVAQVDTAQLSLEEGQTSFRIVNASSGKTQITADFYDAEGNQVASSTVTVYVL